MSDLLQALGSGKVLLMDGAMGTELRRLDQRRRYRMRVNREFLRRWEARGAAIVQRIHSAYVAAGASVVLTNTFQAIDAKSWRAAIRCARSASPSPRFVLGDIGPVAKPTKALAAALFAQCAGLDGVLLETWSSIQAMRIFARECPKRLPLLVSFTYLHGDGGDIRTFDGDTPEGCARAAEKCGAVALGANCGKAIDMDDMLEIVRRYRAVCDLPILVRPNAGTPRRGRYPRTPRGMAAKLPALLKAGVAMIGGCCGTTAAHIKAFRRVVDAWNGRGDKSAGYCGR